MTEGRYWYSQDIPCQVWFQTLEQYFQPFKGQSHESATANELFECTWLFCGVGAKRFIGST